MRGESTIEKLSAMIDAKEVTEDVTHEMIKKFWSERTFVAKFY